MANGNNQNNNDENPLQSTGVRRPQLQPARQNTTRVQLEQEIKERDVPEDEISPQELTLQAANEGRIDLGEEGEEITPQQALNRATVRQAANEFFPQFMKEKQEEAQQMLKDLSDTPRALSAANNFYRGLTEFVPSAIKTKAIIEAGVHNLFAEEGEEIEARFLPDYQLGQEIGRQLDEIFPTSEAYRDEFWTGTMSKAAGQLTGNVVVSLASMGAGTAATLGSTAALNATLGSQFYDEAKAEGATEEEAFEYTILNMGATAGLEALPMARFVKRIDKATGGGFKRILANGFSGSIEEGTTEALQQFVANASGQGIYDSTRDIMDGVYESFGAGALLGAAVNSTLPALMRKAERTKKADELADVYASMEYVAETAEALPGETPMTRNDVNEFLNRYDNPDQEAPDPVVEGETGAGVTNTRVDRNSKQYKDSKKKWKQFWEKYLKSGGLKGKDITVREEKMNALIDKQMEKAYQNFSRLNRQILDHYGSEHDSIYDAVKDENDPVPTDITSRIDKVFRGEAEPNTLPEGVRAEVQRARKHIDQLSVDMVKSGLVQGKLAKTFIKNIGAYVHRDYRAFDQEVEWDETVIPDDVWNSAIAFFRNRRLTAYREKAGENPGSKTLARIRKQAEQDVRKVLQAKNVNSIKRLFTNKRITENKADRDVLMQRQDVPKPIRDLLGEYKDPAVNYINTINEMAQLIEKRNYFDDIAQSLRGELFFTLDEITSAEFQGNRKEYVTGLADNTGSRLSENPSKRLDGTKPPKLYMHQDLYNALTFEAGKNDVPGWLVPLIRVNSIAKYSKTVLSHVAHARNLMGGFGFLNTNGLFFTGASDIKTAWSRATTVFKSYEKLTAKELEAQWQKYVELGLTGGSVRAQEMLDLMKDVNYDPGSFMENFNHNKATAKGEGLYNKSKSWFKKYSRKLTNLYKLEDAFLRTMMFELEKARLQEADPSITDQDVADLVNDLYPNYNRLNESLKLARRFPIISPFISFPAEVVRTQFNTIKRGLHERNSDNPAIRKIGYKRIAGTLTNFAGVTVVGAASQALMRMDDEEEQAIRHFLPPWDRNSIVAYIDASRGKVRYINTSYTNPHEFLIDPMNALIAGDDDRTVIDRFADSMGELFKPLLSEELAFKAIREIRSNKTADGAEIWNPEDTLPDKLQKGFLHFWDAVEPGSISSVERFFEPLVDEESKKNVADEIFGLFGMRISTVDVKRSYGFRIRDFRQRIRNARRVYNSVKYRKGTTTSEQREALKRANNRYREIFNEMKQITDAAQETGVRWSELERIMKDSGLANRDINGLRSGTFEEFKP